MKGQITKERISEAGLILFNKYGIRNVTLQQIADETGISVGNLAYHYHDKEQILKKIGYGVSIEMEKIIATWKNLTGLLDFDNQLTRLYHLLENYSFFFLDILELKRVYPIIFNIQHEYSSNFIIQVQHWYETNTKKGLMVELRADQRKKIAEMIWFISSFWLAKRIVLDKDGFYEGTFKNIIWQQIRPCMTERGENEFDMIVYPGLTH